MDNVELIQPLGEFKWFFPPTDDERLAIFAKHLMDKDRYISDELRNYDAIWKMIAHIFYGNQLNIVYEIGDFQGLVGFLDIIPGWKCSVMLKLWDEAAWTKGFMRNITKVADRVFDVLNLIRMETSTPDPRIEKIAKMGGFKEEGRKRKAFKWDGEIFDVVLFSKIREK